MDNLDGDLGKVIKKQKTSKDATIRGIDRLLDALEHSKMRLDRDQEGTGAVDNHAELTMLLSTFEKSLPSIIKSHKELHNPIIKFGKAVDKLFENNISRVANAGAFAGKEEQLNRAVAEHLLRAGHFYTLEEFEREASVSIEAKRRADVAGMFEVINGLRKKNVRLALDWCMGHSAELAAGQSRLEFLLHRLEFVSLLDSNQRSAAIDFARTHFVRFASTEALEISRVMAAVPFGKRLKSSPYRELTDAWVEAEALFLMECAKLLGLAKESPLEVAIRSGCTAVPKLLQVFSVLPEAKRNEMMASTGEQPVEVEFGKSRRYHSVFICPVSHEAASPSNPPMQLPCGHVICRDSLNKIAKRPRRRFKCFYCPMELTLADATELFL